MYMELEKIKDALNYNAADANDAQLQDDWRIVNGWWATLRSGGNMKYSEQEIKSVALKIMKELIRRNREHRCTPCGISGNDQPGDTHDDQAFGGLGNRPIRHP